MTIKIKHIGVIDRFNGIDIAQTRHYIKISNQTYFDKILETKKLPSKPNHLHPIPMNPDPVYNREIEESIPLTDSDR